MTLEDVLQALDDYGCTIKLRSISPSLEDTARCSCARTTWKGRVKSTRPVARIAFHEVSLSAVACQLGRILAKLKEQQAAIYASYEAQKEYNYSEDEDGCGDSLVTRAEVQRMIDKALMEDS